MDDPPDVRILLNLLSSRMSEIAITSVSRSREKDIGINLLDPLEALLGACDFTLEKLKTEVQDTNFMEELGEAKKPGNQPGQQIVGLGLGEEEDVQLDESYDWGRTVVCDLCHKYLEGIRYKCTFCEDFDACKKCFKMRYSTHPEWHVFQLLCLVKNSNANKTQIN